ncbi:MAG: hypothetical protein HGA55_03355 [Methanoregulaceae archaeon]|nr:hypothetical protein [Methanoregulaceae archaeon]
MIDIDGVLYVGENITPGSGEALKYLDEHGYPFRLVSNTTRLSRASVARKLSVMDFAVPESKIFTPAVAAADYLSRSHHHTAYLLTTDEVAAEISESGHVHHDPESAQSVVIGDADGAVLGDHGVSTGGGDAELTALFMQAVVAGIRAGGLEYPVAGLVRCESDAPRLAAIPEAGDFQFRAG